MPRISATRLRTALSGSDCAPALPAAQAASGRFGAELQLFSGRTIDQPSMFIAGRSDWGAYQNPGALERMQKTACTHMVGTHFVDGAGHWVQQEQPEVVNEALKAVNPRIVCCSLTGYGRTGPDADSKPMGAFGVIRLNERFMDGLQIGFLGLAHQHAGIVEHAAAFHGRPCAVGDHRHRAVAANRTSRSRWTTSS